MIELVQAFLQLRKFLRVKGKACRIIRKASGRIRKECICILQLQDGFIERLINSLNLDKEAKCPSHLLCRILLTALQKIFCKAQGFIDAAKGGEDANLFLQLFILSRPKIRPLDFRDLVGQKVRLPGSCRLIQLLILLAELFKPAVFLPALLHLHKESGKRRSGVGVHHLQLRSAAKKPLVLSLSIYIHKELREFPELFGGHRLRADHALAAIGEYFAFDKDDILLVRLCRQCQKALPLPVIVHAKDQLHQCILCAGSYQTPVCLGTQCQIHRAQQNGLTGAGFSGQNVQTIRKGQLLLLDQCQVFHMKSQQHTQSPISIVIKEPESSPSKVLSPRPFAPPP